jgi:hypothetical protein
MNARRHIDGASYGPDALKAIGQAFDQAWLAIAGNFDSAITEVARQRLAKAILSLAAEDSRDVDVLKRGALEAMALSYYSHPHDRAVA